MMPSNALTSTSKRDIFRYLIAIGVIAAMTLISFQMIRGLLEEIRATEAIVMETAELRSDLHKTKLAARDLILHLEDMAASNQTMAPEEHPENLHNGLRHAVNALDLRLAALVNALVENGADDEVWAFMRAAPYRLEAETRDLVNFGKTLLTARSIDDIDLSEMRALGMAHMAHSDPNIGVDRMIEHLRARISATMQRTAAIHDALGVATLLVLLIEALIIFRPLIRRLGREVERADHAEDELAYLAVHDALTGLLNRGTLEKHIATMLGDSDSGEHEQAVLLVDLDDFKMINDTLGHAAGDAVLKAIGKRLRESCRNDDFVGRLGGDEFVVVWKDITGPETVASRLESLLQSIVQPVSLSGQLMMPSASIGCAFAPRNGSITAEILSCADIAMYQAKKQGKNKFTIFHKDMLEDIVDLASVSAALRNALSNGELILHYQPIFDHSSQQVVGQEALIRWDAAARGLLAPAAFLDDVSRCGLMIEVTDFVLDHALRQLRQWLDAGKHCGFVSVNAPQEYLTLSDLADRVSSALERHQIEPSMLMIEVAETAMASHASAVIEEAFAKLAAIGIRLAYDDFGLSQASLIDLRVVAVDTIKIDRAFVIDLEHRPEALDLLKGVVALAQTLGKCVVVEGIETAEQHALIGRCDQVWVQGFHYAKPAKADVVEILMPSISGRRFSAAS